MKFSNRILGLLKLYGLSTLPFRAVAQASDPLAVQLSQGTYIGGVKHSAIHHYNIPYAQPFERFQPPVAIDISTPLSTSPVDATIFGPICPQLPSNLEFIHGPAPAPPDSGLPSESNCGLLSIYRPITIPPDTLLPVIYWIHGGAFLAGSSQTTTYDASLLAHDANAIVVTVSYRLGAFGFLYNESAPLAPATQDLVLGLEWVHANIRAFAGDANRVTLFGQSAGGYMIQLLDALRPDLFARGIVQSSPAATNLTTAQARSIRTLLESKIPNNGSLTEASTDHILNATQATLRDTTEIRLPFAPVLPASNTTANRTQKSYLIGYQHSDGAAALEGGLRGMRMPAHLRRTFRPPGDQPFTDSEYRFPARKLAEQWRGRGDDVRVFEHVFAPQGFELGATHVVDVALVFGDEGVWKEAPMVGTGGWGEWERRGRAWREGIGRFVWGEGVGDVEGVVWED